MLKSMTGYARASIKNKIGRFVVELQSVNRKFLEINTSLPQELIRFDGEVKKWVGQHIARGHINVKLFVDFDHESPISVKPNLPLVREIKNAFDMINKDLNLESSFDTSKLIEKNGVLLFTEEFPNEEEYRSSLKNVINSGLIDLNRMKTAEGVSLMEDIEKRLNNLKTSIDQIELLAPNAVLKQREKLIAKINEVVPGIIENEERILREICLYAEKVDIVEEITRFNSHIEQFFDLLKSDAGTIGKTLEFIIQEMNRETNTIGSKSPQIEVSKLVIEIKSELERIREQIQNVE